MFIPRTLGNDRSNLTFAYFSKGLKLNHQQPIAYLGESTIRTFPGDLQPSVLGVIISYNPSLGGLKPSFFMVLGSKGCYMGKSGPLKIDVGSVCPLVMSRVSSLFFREISQVIMANPEQCKCMVNLRDFPKKIVHCLGWLHPQSLTWNLKMMVSNRNLLFQGVKFQVNHV